MNEKIKAKPESNLIESEKLFYIIFIRVLNIDGSSYQSHIKVYKVLSLID